MAIDPQLEKVIGNVTDTEKQISEKMKGKCDRPWLDFHVIQKVGKFDYAGVHQLFTRAKSNDEYVTKRKQKNTRVKDLQTAKLSGDYLAALERDHRMRTRSRVRTFVHAEVTATDANGSNDGIIRKNTIDWLGRILTEDGDEQP